MAETKTETDDNGTAASTSTAITTKGSEPLESDKGQTNIADGVVTKVAGLAAGEVPGVHELGGSAARAMGASPRKSGSQTAAPRASRSRSARRRRRST